MYRVTNYDVRDVAYRFLCWAEDNCGPVEKWVKIIEALTQLEKNNTILELGLQERLAAAEREIQRVPLVQSSATSTWTFWSCEVFIIFGALLKNISTNPLKLSIYRPQKWQIDFANLPPANDIWGKVMFSPASVILFTGLGGQFRGGAILRRGVPSSEGVPSFEWLSVFRRDVVLKGGFRPERRVPSLEGFCPYRVSSLEGATVFRGGWCTLGQQGSGTHPTGMLSSL